MRKSPLSNICGSIISYEGSKPEILARIAQTTAAHCKLSKLAKQEKLPLLWDPSMRSPATAVFMYGCETCETITADFLRRIRAR